MGDGTLIDAMLGGLSDPFDDCHMGMTAENVAEKWGITRQAQDELALQSHQRAAAAIKAGYFKEQILPIESKVKGQTIVFDTDEHVKADTTLEKLAKLRPAFKGDGSVTAGNASGLNDAAAAVVLMEGSLAQQRGLHPLGKLVAYAHAGVDPKYMGIGPVPAIRKVLERANLSIKDMDVIELNEAFAAQVLAVIQELDLPLDRTNPNGSGISLGHPVAATGCILTVKALYELRRSGGKYALISMCIGGGQGIAAIFAAM
jgi:acetyl-CoA C-acetyltransferase